MHQLCSAQSSIVASGILTNPRQHLRSVTSPAAGGRIGSEDPAQYRELPEALLLRASASQRGWLSSRFVRPALLPRDPVLLLLFIARIVIRFGDDHLQVVLLWLERDVVPAAVFIRRIRCIGQQVLPM